MCLRDMGVRNWKLRSQNGRRAPPAPPSTERHWWRESGYGPVDGPRDARLRIGSPVRGGGLRPGGFGEAAGGLFIPELEHALRVINLKSPPNRLIAGALWSFG